MATFVIAHGAFGGGWSWSRVRPLLRAAGHEIFTPTYTGLGERHHLANPAVDLSTHVQDVVGVLTYEDLRDVVLVGHSYGGMVITGVAGRAADRLAHLVYLDAFVPQDGESILDQIGPANTARIEELARTQGDGWRIPPPLERDPAAPEPDLRVPHPLACFRQPVTVDPAAFAAVPKTYVRCVDQPVGDLVRSAERARTGAGWRYRELASGHNPQFSMPHELTDLLLEVATER